MHICRSHHGGIYYEGAGPASPFLRRHMKSLRRPPAGRNRQRYPLGDQGAAGSPPYIPYALFGRRQMTWGLAEHYDLLIVRRREPSGDPPDRRETRTGRSTCCWISPLIPGKSPTPGIRGILSALTGMWRKGAGACCTSSGLPTVSCQRSSAKG